MKKILFVSCILFGLISKALPVEVITNFVIAERYLNCDRVFICEVEQIDSLFISSVDSIQPDSFVLKYKVIKEKYFIKIDSTIKGDQSIDLKILYAANNLTIDYSNCKTTYPTHHDSLNTCWMECRISTLYNDASIHKGEKQIVFLNNNDSIIVFATNDIESTLKIIHDVDSLGLAYFSFNNIQTSIINDFKISPNPFSDYIKIETNLNEKTTIQLFDIVGRPVLINEIENESIINVNTKFLEDGLYFYEIKNTHNQTLKTGSLIKQ